MKVVEFKNKISTGDNVTLRLNEALEYVESNQVSNLIILMVCENGDVVDCWANSNKPFTIVGALESIKIEFMNNFIEKR